MTAKVEIEMAEDGEVVILTEPNVSGEGLVGLLLKTQTMEFHASDLPTEANLRIALRPRDAKKLAQSLHRVAKRCLRSQRLH